MNAKAEKFDKMLVDENINCFQKEETKDEIHTVLYRSLLEVEGIRMPIVVITDDSIYGVIRTLVLGKGVDDKNRAAVQAMVNELNASYKPFKYVITEAGEIIMDVSVIDSAEHFDPMLIRFLLNQIITNLNENYKKIVKTVWAD